LQVIPDQVRNASGDGPADLFSDVSEAAQRAAQDRKALGHLPMNSHVQGDRTDRAGDVHRQVLADFLVSDLADFL
jgi:hypothetical protein